METNNTMNDKTEKTNTEANNADTTGRESPLCELACSLIMNTRMPPWLDSNAFFDLLEENEIEYYYGTRHNRTDGEVDYVMSKPHGPAYRINANGYDVRTKEWNDAVEWIVS